MIPTNSGKSPENPLTPSQLNYLAKSSIENYFGSLWLTGEVSNLYRAPSGHSYFTLKDQNSSVKCTFFKQHNFKNIPYKNGDNLVLFGRPSLYEKSGDFQIKIERLELSGIGAMAKQFAELKLKLEALGYFSAESKKPLPNTINSLAIVTSTASAAIKDVLNVIKRRNPLLEINIYHASVQGENAVGEIIDALHAADIKQHDVILLTRGGGSKEDLWTFNDVAIAQTLYNLNTPCVAAIGHEQDTSIADLVADSSAITPSAAAELLTPDMSKLSLALAHNLTLIKKSVQNKLNNHFQQLDIALHRLEKSHPKNQIKHEKNELNNRFKLLKGAVKLQLFKHNTDLTNTANPLLHYRFNFKRHNEQLKQYQTQLKNLIVQPLQRQQTQLKHTVTQLNNLNPLAILSRGYSITLNKNMQSVIRQPSQIMVGDEIETIIEAGKIFSQVVKTEKK